MNSTTVIIIHSTIRISISSLIKKKRLLFVEYVATC